MEGTSLATTEKTWLMGRGIREYAPTLPFHVGPSHAGRWAHARHNTARWWGLTLNAQSWSGTPGEIIRPVLEQHSNTTRGRVPGPFDGPYIPSSAIGYGYPPCSGREKTPPCRLLPGYSGVPVNLTVGPHPIRGLLHLNHQLIAPGVPVSFLSRYAQIRGSPTEYHRPGSGTLS